MNSPESAGLSRDIIFQQNALMNGTALIVNTNVLDTAETTVLVTRLVVSVIKVVLMDGTVNIVNIDVLVTVLTKLHVTR